MNNLIGLFNSIRLVVMDMDGVLTDGKLLLLDDSNWVRKMDIKDGYAIQLAVKKGLKIAVVTGSFSEAVKSRMAKLGVDAFHENVKDKGNKIEEIAQLYGLSKEEILFIGDDMPDLASFYAVGTKACPADAVEEVKAKADYVSRFKGGDGCVRDVLEKILKVQGLWNNGADISSI
jgi:3-deoxy-D-manno-octulosonate 8-phosphate phosphatase (KDO 8-P phosphatase)